MRPEELTREECKAFKGRNAEELKQELVQRGYNVHLHQVGRYGMAGGGITFYTVTVYHKKGIVTSVGG